MNAESYDVAIVGSGVAGLCAAVESTLRGASTIVLEAAAKVGGASAMSGAACCLVDTPEQRKIGVSDNVELALTDWAGLGGPTADLLWARAYLRDSREQVRDWLAGYGIEWSTPALAEGNSVPRWHLPKQYGTGIVHRLLTRLEELGVPVRTGASVSAFLATSATPAGIRGVELADGSQITAEAVIICTGGFVNNRDMLNLARPELKSLPRVLCGGAPTATGTGHRLLDQIGAKFTAMENIWIYPNGTPDPLDKTGSRGLGLRGVTTELWLNVDGRRFHDESLRGGHSGTSALLGQPQQRAWCVFDASEIPQVLLIDNEYFATPEGPNRRAMARFWEESTYAVQAGTPEALADAIGLPAPAVVSTLAAFNSAVREGRDADPDTGRSLAGLTQVGPGGLAAIAFFPLAQKNFGGVCTDRTCAVLDQHDRPIVGLWAAGEVAGMAGGSINGRSGLEGTMFGPCVYSGRIAGKAAAETIARSRLIEATSAAKS